MDAYTFALATHNIFRWVVLAAALFALIRVWSGWLGKRNWTATDDKARTFFTIGMDIQFLIGLILYFVLSPFTRSAMGDFGGAMKNPDLRYFAVEHLITMLLAVVLVHVGGAGIKKASDPIIKHKKGVIFFTIAVVLILIRTPWFRPMFRAFTGE
jgi:hypothetical protein